MTSKNHLQAKDLDKIRHLDTCTVSNAIERFNVRLRNEGFVQGYVHCRFPSFPPMLGFAVTARVRSLSAPMAARCYVDRMDWWEYVTTVPKPRVMVLQDTDPHPGIGAFVGEIHAHIGLALHCVGCVTNGAVRDLAAVERTGFHLFSGSVSVSHSYAHIVDFGEPVEVGGLRIHPGDLIHGDRNGVQTIPQEIVREIPDVAANLAAAERHLIDMCQSANFSMERLAAELREFTREYDSNRSPL